jgi:heat shock protein HslJ
MKSYFKEIVIISIFTFTSCQYSENTTAVEMSKLIGTWKLKSITGSDVSMNVLYPENLPWFIFDDYDNKISGNTSCNLWSTTFSISNNSIKFNKGITTKIYCDNEGESLFLKMIERVDNYNFDSKNILCLKEGNLVLMKFTRK